MKSTVTALFILFVASDACQSSPEPKVNNCIKPTWIDRELQPNKAHNTNSLQIALNYLARCSFSRVYRPDPENSRNWHGNADESRWGVNHIRLISSDDEKDVHEFEIKGSNLAFCFSLPGGGMLADPCRFLVYWLSMKVVVEAHKNGLIVPVEVKSFDYHKSYNTHKFNPVIVGLLDLYKSDFLRTKYVPEGMNL